MWYNINCIAMQIQFWRNTVDRKSRIRERIFVLWNDYRFLLIAFFIPLMIQWMVFIAMEVWPFGNSSVLVLDLNGQYVYFFEELKHKLASGGSLLYTWSRTLGGEFMGMFAYYLSSPFSFLIALFPENHITEGLLLIELLKSGCMGATMAYYLNQSKRSVCKLNIIIFSTCYAMSAYAVVYGHNTMWIDNLIWLPLLTLGIERVIRKGHFKLFVVSLSMCLLTSFYIGYMACLYTAIYFFYYYVAHDNHCENNFWQEENHFWKSLLRIMLYSAVAICIAMIIIYPAYTSLQFGKSTFSTTKWTFTQRFDFLDFFVKLFPGSYDTVRPEGLPVVYCGTIVLLLVPMYFISSRIRWQERLMGGVILSLFVIFMNVNAIDIFWHGFQKPNWLNYRYSYMFIFLLLVFAYKAFTELQFANYKYVVFLAGVYVVMLMFIQKQDYEFAGDFSCVWLSVLCIAVFGGTLYLVYAGKMRGMAVILVSLLVFAELFAAGLLNLIDLDDDVVISSRTSYNSYMDKTRPSVDFIKSYDTSEFYRMEKNFHRKTGDAMALDYYGITNSTSTLNKATIELLHTYGYASKSHWTKYLGGTPVSDALIDMRYVISNTETDNGVWEEIFHDEEHGYYTYYNPYALSLAFAASPDAAALEISDYTSPLYALNAITASVVGENEENTEIFIKLDIDSTDMTNVSTGFTTQHRKYSKKDESSAARIEYTVTVPANMPIYMNVPTDYPKEANLKVNGASMGTIMANETDRVIYIGTYDEEDVISVAIELKDDPIYIKTNQDYFFAMDVDLFKSIYGGIANGNMEITSFEDTLIKGKINVPDGMNLLYTSIPFDEGWHICVDGEEKELIKLQDALIAVEIGNGEHEITMEYLPKCYTLGGAISIFGLVAFAGLIAWDEIRKRLEYKKWASAHVVF